MASTVLTTSLSMPLSSSPDPAENRVVRFDQECILIPESLKAKRAIIATKSYHLPLWRRRTASTGSDDLDSFDGEAASPTLKVTLPRFITKSSSPSRGRVLDKPLYPCLVHRDPSSPPLPRRPIARRPSLPLPIEHPVKYETIPLRACCTNCLQVTEQCIREGKVWQEKFSRGAQRRRSSSVSSDDFSLSPGSSPTVGFAAMTSRSEGSIVTSRFKTAALSITVDEVDRRRKSLELIAPPEPSPVSPTPLAKSSPIEEEDEEQLFPLPSPRRTPSGSPAGSAEASPLPSPNASRIVINGSHESLNSGSEEGVLPKSISRRRCEKGLLMPQVSEGVPTPPSSPSPKLAKPTISIPSPPTLLASSPSSSSSISHARSATSPPARSLPQDIPSPIHTRSSSQPSSSPTKRRQPHFSPSTFFKEALKGVSAISGGSSSSFSPQL